MGSGGGSRGSVTRDSVVVIGKSEAVVPLLSIYKSTDVCGGYVGAGSSFFCCITGGKCSTKSHMASKAKIITGYYIRTSQAKAQTFPILNETKIPNHFMGITDLKTTPLAWEGIIRAFMECENPDEDFAAYALDEFWEEYTSKVSWGGMSPPKEIQKPATETGELFGSGKRTDKGHGGEDEPPKEDDEYLFERVAAIVSEWESLVSMVDKHEKDTKWAGPILVRLEKRVNAMRTLIGDPEPGLEVKSLWSGVAAVQDSVSDLFKALTRTDNELAIESQEVKATSKQVNDQQAELDAIVQALTDMASAGLSGAGGAAVSSGTLAIGGASSTTATNRGPGTASTNQQGVTVQRLADLEVKMRTLEVKLTEKSVSIGSEVFGCIDDVAVFVTTYMSPVEPFFGCFFDIISALEKCGRASKGSAEAIKERSDTNKAGFMRGTDAATIETSFGVTVPSIFQSTAKMGTEMCLDKVPKFVDFDGGDGKNGMTVAIDDAMVKLVNGVEYSANQHYGSEAHRRARNLATELATRTHNFWSKLQTFVSSFHRELMNTAKASDQEAWDLIREMLQAIFSEIAQARQQGSAAENQSEFDKTRVILWATLQAHRVMESLVVMRFRKHPCVIPSLTLFLYKNRASGGTIDELSKKVDGALSMMKLIQSEQHKLLERVKTIEREAGKAGFKGKG